MYKNKIFLFANIPVPGFDLSYGGATILSQNILDYVKADKRLKVTHKPIRNTWRPKLHILDHLIWIIKFPFEIKNQDVIHFQGTWDFNFTVAPFLWVWAKLFRKKIIYQFIGGDFIDRYQKLPTFFQSIYRSTLLNSDTVFFETIEQVNYFKSQNIKNCIWVPNARKPIVEITTDELFRKKFVYLSRIIPEKGIDEIIEVSLKLSKDYQVDIIGPLNERYYSSQELNRGAAKFINTLVEPTDLKNVLSKYDVLLLPTYFEGEGYPGIIIDCLSLGIPVITTKWKALPEMIQNNYNGRLIDIKNNKQLEEAILHFNQNNYEYYRENALKSFENFNSDVVFEKIVNSYLNE